jgi:hypothetical protein
MGRLEGYRDVVEFVYPALDPNQFFIGKKGFKDWLMSLSDEELLEFAKQYPVWRDRRLRDCALIKFVKEVEGKVVEDYRVYVPKLRALRKDYYAWIKGIKLPKGRYRLLTLTLGRWVGIVDAWKNISRWVSRCLHRVRNRLKREFNVDIFYVWVIEAHKDGYPHVHVLFSASRYVRGLTFERFLQLLISYWVDDEGRRLCAENGVDVKYVGTDVKKVRDYLLKYLVKDHDKIWRVEVEQGLVRVRLSTLLIWVFRVRLFGFSQKIKRAERDKLGGTFMGKTSVYRLWRFVYDGWSFRSFMNKILSDGRSKSIEEDRVPLLLGKWDGFLDGLSVLSFN